MTTPTESKRLNHALAQAVNPTSRISMDGIQWAMDLFGIKPCRYEKGDGVNWHTHEEGHFEIVLSGRMLFSSEQTELTLKPFQVLFIPPGTKHRWRCSEGGVMIGLIVFIEGPRRAEMLEFLNNVIPSGFLMVKSREIRAVLNEILVEGLGDKPFNRYMLGQNFFSLACKTLREIPTINSWEPSRKACAADSPKQEIVDNIKLYIDEHLSDPLTLQAIAERAKIGVRHLNRIFYEIEHDTPHRYLLKQRLNHARGLILRNPHAPVKAVAFESGFTTNTSYFSRQFKRHYHSLPTAFRDRILAKR